MGCLTVEQVKNHDSLSRIKVFVPEWGKEDDYVYAVEMTKRRHTEFLKEHYIKDANGSWNPKDGVDMEVALVLLVTCNDEGERLFSDDDAEWLVDKGLAPLQRLAQAAIKVNGLADEDDSGPRTVGHHAKN